METPYQLVGSDASVYFHKMFEVGNYGKSTFKVPSRKLGKKSLRTILKFSFTVLTGAGIAQSG
jgi:hypothetical protein